MAQRKSDEAGTRARRSARAKLATTRPIALNTSEQTVFEAAVRQMSTTEDEIADAIRELGVWFLLEVFGDDTRAALGLERRMNPVWLEILRRSGTETIRFGAQTLRNILRCAAWDHRIPDDEFRNLDFGRKVLLLPLNDATLLRKAAQHVSRANLTQDATGDYVTTVLAAQPGAGPDVRVSVPRVKASLRRFRARYGAAAFRKRLSRAVSKLDDDGRAELLDELQSARDDLDALLGALRKR